MQSCTGSTFATMGSANLIKNFDFFLIFEKWRCGKEMFEAHENLLLKFL